MIHQVKTKEEINEYVTNNDKVMLQFSAPWCGPCKMLSPIMDELSSFDGGIVYLKVDIDESPELPSQFGVRGIPTVIAFDGGVQSTRFSGYKSKKEVEDFLIGTYQ